MFSAMNSVEFGARQLPKGDATLDSSVGHRPRYRTGVSSSRPSATRTAPKLSAFRQTRRAFRQSSQSRMWACSARLKSSCNVANAQRRWSRTWPKCGRKYVNTPPWSADAYRTAVEDVRSEKEYSGQPAHHNRTLGHGTVGAFGSESFPYKNATSRRIRE